MLSLGQGNGLDVGKGKERREGFVPVAAAAAVVETQGEPGFEVWTAIRLGALLSWRCLLGSSQAGVIVRTDISRPTGR